MPDIGPPEHLFVYGTLLSTAGHPLGRLLRTEATLIGQARLQGLLYLVESIIGSGIKRLPLNYPGCVLSNCPDDTVHGELYAIHNPGFLNVIDAYEECGPGFPGPQEYVRVPVEVETADHARVLAWVYLYNLPVDRLTPIPSGCWPGTAH